MSARADDSVAKQQMLKDIAKDGYTKLENYPDELKNKQALNTLDVMFTGAGLVTDLLTPGLAFERTLESREVKERISNKYD